MISVGLVVEHVKKLFSGPSTQMKNDGKSYNDLRKKENKDKPKQARPRSVSPYPCHDCGGTGYMTVMDECPTCSGEGEIWK